MNLEEVRGLIDSIDERLAGLIKQRMELSAQVADYKKAHNMPVLAAGREREIQAKMAELCGEELERYVRVLYSTMFDISRAYQTSRLGSDAPLNGQLMQALEHTSEQFPRNAVVACQGIEGAYSQLACEKLFASANIAYFKDWSGVFSAVEQGMCRYGILPIENSSAGSVTAVYDLMKQHRFYVVRSVRLRVHHSLLALPGTRMEDVTEIISHEQAINQCGRFLEGLGNVKITVCENTAMAAQMVAASGRKDVAALSSDNCAAIYGLTPLKRGVQDNDNNYTRFICIAKDLEIYPGASRISLMLSTPHQPGALYRIITKFACLELNLTKLESRPVPGTDFEFRFYFDLDGWVGDPAVRSLLCELAEGMDEFVFLGNYNEII